MAPATASSSTAGYAAAHAGDHAVVPLKADLSRFDAQGAFTRDPAHGKPVGWALAHHHRHLR